MFPKYRSLYTCPSHVFEGQHLVFCPKSRSGLSFCIMEYLCAFSPTYWSLPPVSSNQYSHQSWCKSSELTYFYCHLRIENNEKITKRLSTNLHLRIYGNKLSNTIHVRGRSLEDRGWKTLTPDEIGHGWSSNMSPDAPHLAGGCWFVWCLREAPAELTPAMVSVVLILYLSMLSYNVLCIVTSRLYIYILTKSSYDVNILE